MPNDHNSSDRKLSELLGQAEPPKSPEHLDEAILSFARENAPGVTTKSPWQFMSASGYWLNQHWVSALTTVSVAVIAVSISLQNLRTESEPATLSDSSVSSPSSAERFLEVTPNRQIAETDSVRQEQAVSAASEVADEASIEAEKISDANVARTTEPQPQETVSPQALAIAPRSRTASSIEETNAPAAPSLQNEPSAIAPPAVVEERSQQLRTPSVQQSASVALTSDEPIEQNELIVQIEQIEQIEQIDQIEQIVQPDQTAQIEAIEATEQPDPASTAQVASNDTAADIVEEVVVTGSFVRDPRGFSAASPITQSSQEALRSYPQFTEESRNQYVTLLNRVLINFDEQEAASTRDADSVVYSPELVDSIITAFNEIETTTALDAAGNRYTDARSGFTEFELPENLELAIQLLQLVRSDATR